MKERNDVSLAYQMLRDGLEFLVVGMIYLYKGVPIKSPDPQDLKVLYGNAD